MKKSLKVAYIAGPIAGVKDYKTSFTIAEAKLWAEGYKILNPAKLPADLSDSQYLPICISMVEQADCVFLLKGWEHSLGAVAEATYAARQGKHIYEIRDDGDHHLKWNNNTHWFEEG